METSEKVVTSNLIWRFLERFGAQLVTFVVSIILARILDPTIYGTIALVSAIITILEVFINSGFGTALIQKKDSDDVDFSTIFYFNIVSSLVLYAALFFVAPLIGRFYNNAELVPVIRVLCLVIIIYAFKETQYCYVAKHMQFKKFFFSTLIGTVVAAVVGVVMAVKGFGVWALVAQTLANNFIDTLVLWIIVGWKPKKKFSFTRFKKLFSFAWKLFLSSLLDATYNEIRQFVIGKKYSTSDLAYFNRGKTIPSFLITNINTSVESVLLPTMAKEQDKKENVKKILSRSIIMSAFLIFPLVAGIAVCGNSIVLLVLGSKWLPCVPFLRIFCLYFAFYPINTANLNAIKAMGRTDIILKLEITKKVVGIGSVFVAMWFGVEAIAYSLVFIAFFELIINAIPNKRLLNYGLGKQLLDIMKIAIITIIMAGVVLLVDYYSDSGLLTLAKQVLVGVMIYFTLAPIFKIDALKWVASAVSSLFKRIK